jgi:NADH-quinone oxidoreductase subunit L
LEVLELLFISGLMVRGSAGMTALIAMLAKVCYIGKVHIYTLWFMLGTLGFILYSAGIFE